MYFALSCHLPSHRNASHRRTAMHSVSAQDSSPIPSHQYSSSLAHEESRYPHRHVIDTCHVAYHQLSQVETAAVSYVDVSVFRTQM